MTRTDSLKLLLGDDLCCEHGGLRGGGYWREAECVFLGGKWGRWGQIRNYCKMIVEGRRIDFCGLRYTM